MDWAKTYYVSFLNQTRLHKHLLADPNGIRTFHPKTPVKWALLSVLSTRALLSIPEIMELFYDLSYRSRRSLSTAIKRCLIFGLAESIGRNKHRRIRLTGLGRQIPHIPRKVMKETTAERVRGVLGTATQWLAVSDIHTKITTGSHSSIRRALRAEGTHVNSPNLMMVGGTVQATYKGMKIPGDRYGRCQWAMAVADTTNWANATPKDQTNCGNKARTKKQKSSPTALLATGRLSYSTANVSLNPRYQGVPMCLSATTATKLSLIKAVGDLVILEFIPAQKKFSAYDVTKRLREIVLGSAKGTIPPGSVIDTNETGTVFVQGTSVAKIEHDDVKEIVHELFNAGAMSGYDRIHTGQHFEYDLAATIAATNQTAATQAVAPVVTPADPLTPDPTVVTGATGAAYDGSSTI